MSYPIYMVPAGDVLPVMFSSYAGSTGASVTLSGLAVTDIEIYKDGSTTQRASDAGYTLLDTDGIDFDGITGIHGFSIDTGDNTDSGFYTVGAWFHVVVSAVTIDSQTVSFIACAFRLMAAEGVAGKPKVDVDAFGGTAGTFSGGRPEVNTTHAAGTAWGSGAITAASIASDAITAAKIADGAIDAATFAANAITSTVLAADAITAAKVAADVTTELQSGLATASALSTLQTSVDDLPTNSELTTALAAADDAVLAAIADVQSDTNDIQTRLPAALTAGGNMKADVLAVDGSTDASDRLQKVVQGNVFCTVGVGSTTTSIVTSAMDPAAAVADQFKGRIVTFKNDTTTAALRGQSTDITASTDAGVLTVTALTTAPADTDTFTIS